MRFSPTKIAVSIFILQGCTTPQIATENIDRYLGQGCKKLITDTSIFAYQYTVQSPMGRGVFAMADDGKNQVCAYATVRDAGYEWLGIEQLALKRCEDLRIKNNVNSYCEVFARNFDIVWTGKKNIPPITPATERSSGEVPSAKDNFSLESAKSKCEELGFVPKTEKFGQCVLQISK